MADTRNHTARRPARARRWGPWLALLGILVAGLFVAWAKMDTTQLAYEAQRLRDDQAELQRQQRLLSSELARLRSPAYLSDRAAELGLSEPQPGVVIRVE